MGCEKNSLLTSGRNAARMTLGGGFPTRTFRSCGGFPVPHSPRFRKPPSHPGRSVFPSPLAATTSPRRVFPMTTEANYACPLAPPSFPVLSPVRHPGRLTLVLRLCCPARISFRCPLFTESPFASGQCCRPRRAVLHASAGVTRLSSLVRAHASDRAPLDDFGGPYSVESLQVTTSPCWRSALPDVISAILVPAPGSVPRHGSTVLSSVSSRGTSASPKGQTARPVGYSRNAVLCGEEFRGCNHSLMFRLRYLLGPQTAPTFRAISLPPLGRIHRAVFAPLPVRELRHRYVSESDN